jgi:uroporphyrin-3 C-methyltransferase
MATAEQKQIDQDVIDVEVVSPKASPKTGLLFIAIILVLLVSMAGVYWLYQQGNAQQQKAQMDFEQLQLSINEQTRTLGEFSQELVALQQLQNQHSLTLKSLLERDELSRDDIIQAWQLEEVTYLLNMANQKALLMRDVQGALAALDLADSALVQMGDYRLHPLRALIAEEKLALETLADIDVAGMAIQLQTLAAAVKSLRVKQGPVHIAEVSSVAEENALTWQKAAGDIWQQLRSLVVIRHDDKGDSAVLVPEQRYFLYQNVRLQLESTRFALLTGDQAAFEYSLQTAIDWLDGYFVGQEYDAMRSGLAALQRKDISIKMPDISGSLNWLEAYQP